MAIFYVDLYNGNDATRATLTNVVVSNSAGVALCTFTAHGLITGQCVVLSAFTAWLNKRWSITVLTANTFTLDGSAWVTTADATGNVVPTDGNSWADAWKTVSTGGTVARLLPGDVIRVSKTPDPISMGNALWTKNLTTVELTTAQTANITLCETLWTAANGGTCAFGINTDAKQGTNSAKFTFGTAPTVSTKQAYFATGLLDLSAYQTLSFWIKSLAQITIAGNIKVCLCSDTLGDVVVNSFDIPVIPIAGFWHPFALPENSGGNLGNSIQSIAFYSGNTITGLASRAFILDNFIACTQNGLSHNSVISKGGLPQGEPGDHAFLALQSINGTTLRLDAANSASNASILYRGVTETVETFLRNPFLSPPAGDNSVGPLDILISGTEGNLLDVQGGFNTATSLQDGETYFSGSNCLGRGTYVAMRDFIKLNRFSFYRYNMGCQIQSVRGCVFDNISNTGSCNYGLYLTSFDNSDFNYIGHIMYNGSGGALIGGTRSLFRHIGEVCTQGANLLFFNLFFNNVVEYMGILDYGGNAALDITTSDNNHFNYIESVSYCSGTGIRCYVSNGNFINVNLITGNTTAQVSTYQGNDNVFSFNTPGGVNGVNFREGKNYIINSNCPVLQIHPYSSSDFEKTGYMFVLHHNNIRNNNYIITSGAIISWQNIVFQGADPGSWNFHIYPDGNAFRTTRFPIRLKIAETAYLADLPVTIKAWAMKAHSTNLGLRLLVEKNIPAGITTEVISVKTDDINWEQLSITFTPTQSGVTEIWIECWKINMSAMADAYVGSIEITQA